MAAGARFSGLGAGAPGRLSPQSLGTAALRLGAKAGLGANVKAAQANQKFQDDAYARAMQNLDGGGKKAAASTGRQNVSGKVAPKAAKQPNIEAINKKLAQRNVVRPNPVKQAATKKPRTVLAGK